MDSVAPVTVPDQALASRVWRFLGEPFIMPLVRAWHFRELIRAVVRRELAVRFRGSILGWLWAIFGPLVMLIAYTVIFSGAIGARTTAASHGVGNYALSIFSGLIVFNLFSELAARAPMLLHEHANVIKKSIFPSETLAWTAAIRAFVYAGISFGVMLVFQIALTHALTPMTLLLPLVAIPFFLFLLGATWFLTALGSFTRDVTHLMASIIPVFMFATPLFYSINDVPENLRPYFHCNIIGNYVEMLRALVLENRFPDLGLYLGTVIVSLIVFRSGYRFFMRYKAVFVDII
jgi:lipopolysaccharide transport system permease protein